MLLETTTAGNGKTETVAVAAPVHPLAFETTTEYPEVAVGFTWIDDVL